MIKDAINGFCMALADSVPGVSGGTVAFLMGFYDKFITSISDLFYGKSAERKEGIRFLLRLGLGWVIGMSLAVLALNALFEGHIHFVSSLFIGLILGAIPVVCIDEAPSMKQWKRGILFLFLGAALVIAVTALTTSGGSSSMDLLEFTPGMGVRLFFTGMIAICAMFLPGISGSTMLLIFGAYLPVMTALKGLLTMETGYLPGIICFVCGIVAGAVSVVRLLKAALERYRPQMIYLIFGMMVGSLYAIVMGPTTLSTPQAPLSLSNFSVVACIIGFGLVAAMEAAKVWENRKQQAQKAKAEADGTVSGGCDAD